MMQSESNRRFWFGAVFVVMLAVMFAAAPAAVHAVASADASVQVKSLQAKQSTADHSKFKELQVEFKKGPDVTKACLVCHTEAAKHIMKTKHWTWEAITPQGQVLGKKNVVNNYCVGIESNEPRCTSCHIGYGWKDDSFDFTKEANVDCLVCHDTTGTYKKFPTAAGHPAYEPKEFPPKSGKIWKPVDLAKVAQNVGKTSRQTCGACHFKGGGGEAVKHGDLDSSLIKADKDLDVHMDAQGLNFTCSTCHTAVNHEIAGSRYEMTAKNREGIVTPGKEPRSLASCESCHGLRPHGLDIQIDGHVSKVACQTCHIPTFSRAKATKMMWDWSTAGQKKPNGKPIVKKDEDGNVVYHTKKGDFKWEKDVIPDFVWFNGEAEFTTLESKIDASETVKINSLGGEYKDPKARIWPVKRFEGKQPYDSVNNTLVVPHLFGKDKEAYWKSYDWNRAITAGMKKSGAPYSGQYDFVKTEMLWPQAHMVAPKEKAVSCESCHSRDGRLAHLGGFYIPGRDGSSVLDALGLMSVIGSIGFAGVMAVRSRKQ
jgi:octaheme c-type cytochrome (tetrathionate reductase family)